MAEAKAIYKALDAATTELLDLDFNGDDEIVLIDAFAAKNTVWKPAGVSRFSYAIKKGA